MQARSPTLNEDAVVTGMLLMLQRLTILQSR